MIKRSYLSNDIEGHFELAKFMPISHNLLQFNETNLLLIIYYTSY